MLNVEKSFIVYIETDIMIAKVANSFHATIFQTKKMESREQLQAIQLSYEKLHGKPTDHIPYHEIGYHATMCMLSFLNDYLNIKPFPIYSLSLETIQRKIFYCVLR